MKKTEVPIKIIGLFLCLLFVLNSIVSHAQEKLTISGYIKDNATGEELIGAAVYIKEIQTGSVSNAYGFYSITVPKGDYELRYSYIGYKPITREISLTEDKKLNIELEPEDKLLEEVVISGRAENENITSVEPGQHKMQINTIKELPAFMGEVDVIKSIQFLPGISSQGEGSSFYIVRGGNADQNLVLLDEAIVYNTSHFLGLFSVFNPDAIKDVQINKGGFSARYGGRVSSVMEVRMKEGNMKNLSVSGGIGLVSSRVSVEGPIKEETSSFYLSARRTYLDLFLQLSDNDKINDKEVYFYDVNAKLNYQINSNNRIFISGYFGQDYFKNGDRFDVRPSNATTTLRWNHLFNDKLFSNLTLLYSQYKYQLKDPSGKDAFIWKADINDLSWNYDFTYYPNPNHTLTFGLQNIYHRISPGVVEPFGDSSAVLPIEVPQKNALEQALYIDNEQKITERFSARYGLRLASFTNIGSAKEYIYGENHNLIDSVEHSSGEIYNQYLGLEPRISLRFQLNSKSAIKASYDRMRQHLHQTSNSNVTSPMDVWFPSSPRVKPLISDQLAIGYFRNFMNNKLEANVEVFYKDIQNQIDFRGGANILQNPYLEGELRFGEAYSYGMEFLLKKTSGAFTGWLAYTYSRSYREIEEINNGERYPSNFDRPHNLTLFASFEFSKKWSTSTNFIYYTGSPITLPTSLMYFNNTVIPLYNERNSVRMPDYHRLDVSATYNPPGKENSRWESQWVFSIYNLYYRKNVFNIFFEPAEENPAELVAKKTYLFPIVPSVTYNFKF